MEELEREAGLDRWSLARHFRAAFGTSPSRFRTLRQLDRARGVVQRGTALAEAALQAGFADQSHMSRQFKRAYGLTPARWAAALTYTLFPGKTPEYLRLYQSEGMAIQTRILGRMVGYFTTEIGRSTRSSTCGATTASRSARSAARRCRRNAGWKADVAKIQPLIHTQETKILKPTAFSPIK